MDTEKETNPGVSREEPSDPQKVANKVSAENPKSSIPDHLKPYFEGPFLGRLRRPDIFGDNPDLYDPSMTPEQERKLFGYDNDPKDFDD